MTNLPTLAAVYRFIEAQVGARVSGTLSDSTSLTDLGISSVSLVALLVALDAEFGVSLEVLNEIVRSPPTIRGLAICLASDRLQRSNALVEA